MNVPHHYHHHHYITETPYMMVAMHVTQHATTTITAVPTIPSMYDSTCSGPFLAVLTHLLCRSVCVCVCVCVACVYRLVMYCVPCCNRARALWSRVFAGVCCVSCVCAHCVRVCSFEYVQVVTCTFNMG